MSQSKSTSVGHAIFFLLGFAGIIAGLWFLLIADPSLQGTAGGLVSLGVGGVILFRTIHKTNVMGLNDAPEGLGSEHLAPDDPLAWMDHTAPVADEKQTQGLKAPEVDDQDDGPARLGQATVGQATVVTGTEATLK